MTLRERQRLYDLLRNIPALAAELREARAAVARVRELAEAWRYKGEFGWGPWQEGYGPDQEGYILNQAAADLRRALDGEATDG